MTTSISMTTVSSLSSSPAAAASSSSSSCLPVSFSPRITPTFEHLRGRRMIPCQVALKSDSPTSSSVEEEEEDAAAVAKVGARVKVKVPLKVYHVPKVPEVDLTGMEGEIKQYVCLWKGKRISANFPFKVAFVTEIEGRGPVKFFAHLREDELEFL